ncbi:MAG: histidine phosphatase family protein [Bacteroidia bacterium]|nr:histidine phosphatase family protein [Bacteroidia bacterium]
MENKLIYIIRHGETEFNKLGIVQGSGINSSLNERGISQAGKFYEMYKDIKFQKIYTSALVRTQESVLPFIEAGKSYQTFTELNEISWGVFEGKPQNETERKAYWDVVNAWKNGDYSAKIVNGESAAELQHRQLNFIEFLKRQKETCVLVATHGRAMKSLLCTMLQLPLSEMESFEHSNLCLYVLEFNGNSFELIIRNNTNHLKI